MFRHRLPRLTIRPQIAACPSGLVKPKRPHVPAMLKPLAWLLATVAVPVYAVHLDVEIWADGDAMQAGFCRTPGAVGCDLTQLTGSLNLPAGTLPVDGASGQMVYLTDFRDFSGGPYKTPNPGFQAVDGALEAGELVNYQALGILEYWNPETRAWQPAPANVRVKLAGAIDPAYVITDYNQCGGQLFCFADGFDNQTAVTLFTGSGIAGKAQMVVDAANNSGSLHTHLNFFLENPQGTLGGPVGAYLLELQVGSNRRIQSSTPFYVLFNAGLSTEDFSAALLERIETLPVQPVAPIANAGADRSVKVGDTVVLDGSASYDPDAAPNALSYQWLQTVGSPVELSGGNSAGASFVASQAGQYAFRLTVNDGAASANDEVAVTVSAADTPIAPVADAGADRTVGLNAVVTLDAGASYDPEPGPGELNFSWQQTAGTSVILQNADTATPGFTPVQTGRYAFRVAVGDGNLIAYDEVVVTVPEPPLADAGADKLARLHSLVALDGSASVDTDPGPDALSYRWQQTQGEAMALNGADDRSAYFTPTRPGNYSFKLAVGDGVGIAYDEVTYTVPALGDVDLDGDVDRIDVALILRAIKKAPKPIDVNDVRDLDGNRKINKADARAAKRRCTLRRCRPTRR
ncbi:PKD domain-containing protein [Methylomonas rhizoryzae]|uniref:PKD domain-containing protein n=1 Tax=Methylomonas rhizoryzae TaxID=2608981 RepID=UPI0012324A78|nr:REJ domain-containing protein [Methylomonas rhizoryzae]